MMAASCSVCGISLLGWPDEDVTCSPCEVMNFAGNALRAVSWVPRPVWGAPPPDSLPALTCVEGPWTWHEEHGVEETDIG